MRDQHQRLRGDDRDRREGVGIEAELGEEVLADHQRPLRRGQQRVAVGLRASHHLGAEVLRGAGAMLDDHRLAPLRRQLVGDDPRNGVEVGAGRRRHDDLDRPVRVGGLRLDAAGSDREQRGRDEQARHMPILRASLRIISPAPLFSTLIPVDAISARYSSDSRLISAAVSAGELPTAVTVNSAIRFATSGCFIASAIVLRQPRGDLRRRLRRRDHGEPVGVDDAGQGFGDGWHVWQQQMINDQT